MNMRYGYVLDVKGALHIQAEPMPRHVVHANLMKWGDKMSNMMGMILKEDSAEWWDNLDKDERYETGLRVDLDGDPVDENELIECYCHNNGIMLE